VGILEGILWNEAVKEITYPYAFNTVLNCTSHAFIEKDVTCKIFIACSCKITLLIYW
jgi:hypothetical protein